VLLFAFCTPGPARAGIGDPIQTRVYETARISGEAPVLDGRLDEPVWNEVDWSGDFVQRDPNDGAAPAAQTRFKVLYDDEALYFAFRAFDDPKLVTSMLARRDWFPGDWVEVNIDSRGDKRTAYSFTYSLSGTRGDEYVSQNGNDWNGSWDPVWSGASQVDDQGWTAETRIPLSQLRFDSALEQTWGLQVQRRLFRAEERSTWQRIPKDAAGWVSNFGELRGLRGIRPSRRFELLPYGVARAETYAREAGNPFRDGSSGDFDFGLDGKIGIGSDFNLDLTINPDFGQVEADPSEVNLTAFETYFSERRPFFIEGADILALPVAPAVAGGDFTSDVLFYSRRIGKRPSYRLDLADGESANAPDNTSILGACKLSGKTAGGLSIGLLESVTARERAEIDLAGARREDTVEPATNYFVGRLSQEWRSGQTAAGAMLTSVVRDIEDEHLEFLRRKAWTGGFDLRHEFHDRDFRIEARLFGSYLRGSPESIALAQRSSARYFQRPDNGHAQYDPTRTTLGGHAGSLLLTRTGHNSRLMSQTGFAWRTPGFEINDLGYMRRADEINQFTWIGYSIRNPFSIFNSWQLNGNQWLDWDCGGSLLRRAVNINNNASFRNRISYYWGLSRHFAQLSNTELRGGPASRWPGRWVFNVQFNSDGRRALHGGLGSGFIKGDERSRDYAYGWTSLTYRPSNAVNLTLEPTFERDINRNQYVDARTFEEQDRYLFGSLDQRTLSLVFRLDYCVTPNLTLQYYAAPFVSAGRYRDFKRITDPRAERYADRSHVFPAGEIVRDASAGEYAVDEDGDGTTDYTFGDPDFNAREFRSNLVARWEYAPGSTLFLVWSQGRSSFRGTGEFDLTGDMGGLFAAHPDDVFLIKFNKWLSL
jgi:hypothetical protein